MGFYSLKYTILSYLILEYDEHVTSGTGFNDVSNVPFNIYICV